MTSVQLERTATTRLGTAQEVRLAAGFGPDLLLISRVLRERIKQYVSVSPPRRADSLTSFVFVPPAPKAEDI